MDRREFLGVSAATGIGLMMGACKTSHRAGEQTVLDSWNELKILPYPQQVEVVGGELPIGAPKHFSSTQSKTVLLARQTLAQHLPSHVSKSMPVRMGSVEEGFDSSWLNSEEIDYLKSAQARDEASIVKI